MNFNDLFNLACLLNLARATASNTLTPNIKLNNYRVNINSRFQQNTIHLEEYTFNDHNRLLVDSPSINYEIIYTNSADSSFRRLENSNNCEEIKHKPSEFYVDTSLGPGFVFRDEKSNATKIGPTALIFFFMKDHEKNEWLQEYEEIQGFNVISYRSGRNFDALGFSNASIELTFKANENELIPVKLIWREDEEKIMIFEYYRFQHLNENSIHHIAPATGCPELKHLFDGEKPNFVIDEIVEIEFDDVSSIESSKLKFHVHNQEQIARRLDEDGAGVLDMRNKVLYSRDLDEKCSIELFSSQEKFDKLKDNFFKNVKLILDIKMDDFTFIGIESQSGLISKKFQQILTDDQKVEIKTIFFRNDSMHMLIRESINGGQQVDRTILNIMNIRKMNYDENYRRLFTMPECKSSQDYVYVHIYSLPLDEDPHLDDKLDFMTNKEDFIISELIHKMRNDLDLDLNAFSTSNLERQANHFVGNLLILNVENYLEKFIEIHDIVPTKSPLELGVKDCAYRALDQKYGGFKHCKKSESEKERCFLLEKVINVKATAIAESDDFCQSFKKKMNKEPKQRKYTYHLLIDHLTKLINRKYSRQIVHNVKFVFHKIRFSTGLNLIDDREKMFRQFRTKLRIKNPLLPTHQSKESRLLSLFDCYNRCINQNECNSFSFCKYITSTKVEVKCHLSDLILFENEHLINTQRNLSKNMINKESLKERLEDQLVQDGTCETYSINYLKHFKSYGDSMLATSESLQKLVTYTVEECARRCQSVNRNESNKCGKLEICYDENEPNSNQIQCNLKVYSHETEIQLKNNRCEYFRINSLVDYHQTDLNEEQDLEVYSTFKSIEHCAKDCTSFDSCGEFNFCWDYKMGARRYETEEGICLFRDRKQQDSVKFNSSLKAWNCVTMIKNNQIIASERERPLNKQMYRYKYVHEYDPDELSRPVFSLFMLGFFSFGFILGWIGYHYYTDRILPAYLADKGTYFPTRIKKEYNEIQGIVANKKQTQVNRIRNANHAQAKLSETEIELNEINL